MPLAESTLDAARRHLAECESLVRRQEAVARYLADRRFLVAQERAEELLRVLRDTAMLARQQVAMVEILAGAHPIPSWPVAAAAAELLSAGQGGPDAG